MRRIQILANGSGSVSELQNHLGSLRDSISNTIDSLNDVNKKLSNLYGGIGKLSDAQNNINSRISQENSKKGSVTNLIKATDDFLKNTVATDKSVAKIMSNSQKAFTSKYAWARPNSSTAGKTPWEILKDIFQSGKEALANAWNTVKKFVKEHILEIEIIIGTIALAVAIVLTVLSGGTLGAVLILLAKVAFSTLLTGGISALIAAFRDEDVWDAFVHGLASGYMFAGIFSAISAGFQFANSLKNVNELTKIDIWNKISNPGPNIEGTSLPKYFNINIAGQELHVHPNAMKHIVEYVVNHNPQLAGLNGDILLKSFYVALEDMFAQEGFLITESLEQIVVNGGWEFIISAPREIGLDFVIKHARFLF